MYPRPYPRTQTQTRIRARRVWYPRVRGYFVPVAIPKYRPIMTTSFLHCGRPKSIRQVGARCADLHIHVIFEIGMSCNFSTRYAPFQKKTWSQPQLTLLMSLKTKPKSYQTISLLIYFRNQINSIAIPSKSTQTTCSLHPKQIKLIVSTQTNRLS